MAKRKKRNAGLPDVQPQGVPEYAGDTTVDAERDRIAERAYQKYIERGGRDGRDLEDWLEAEREVVRNGDERDPRGESGS